MKFIPVFMAAICFIACNNQSTADVEAGKVEVKIITNDTIPRIRTEINRNAVATFSKVVPDDLNKWRFAVSVFETKETFHYLMKIEYMEMRESDTLKIPNFGVQPKIEIREGKEKYSCIIGFFDKDNNFKEYKAVTANGDKLKVTILHRYAVSTFQDEVK